MKIGLLRNLFSNILKQSPLEGTESQVKKRSEIFKRTFVESLQELSDRDFQERIWTDKDTPQCMIASFTEAAINLFDDALVTYALEEGTIIYDKKVTQALWELSDATDAVNEFRPEEEIINDPLMQVVREKAAEVLALIKTSGKSENTAVFIEEGTLMVIE